VSALKPPAILALVAAIAGCAPEPPIAPPRAAAAAPAPRDPECSPRVLEEPPDVDPARTSVARSPGAPVDLALLLRPETPKRASPPPRPRIDLGRVSRKMQPPAPFVGPDSVPLGLPHDLPSAGLTPDLRDLWDREEATLNELRRAQVGVARAERRERGCRVSSCADLACIGTLKESFAGEVRAVRERRAAERRELVEGLRRYIDVASGEPRVSALVALASTLEDMARQGERELSIALKEPIALYELAASISASTTDLGWFARYRRAAALHDAGETERAKGAFFELAQASPPGRRTALAMYEAAHLERDPGRAADLYQRAVSAGDKGSSALWPSLRGWARAALEAERPADALAAGLLLCEEALTHHDDWEGRLDDGAEAVAEAFGRLVVASAKPHLGQVPAAIAARVADNAVRRFDVSQAIHAWETLLAHAPGATEAPAARAALAAARERAAPRTEMEGRLAALLQECGRESLLTPADSEIASALDAASPRSPQVTVRPAKPGSPTRFLRCVEARGPAYFVEAPADLRASLTLAN
jgi:hypothetical protein